MRVATRAKFFHKCKKHSKYIYLLEVDIHLHSKDWGNGKQDRVISSECE